MQRNLPSWVKKRIIAKDSLFEVKRLLSESSINTVCESSLCPNLTECFSKKKVTFLILGKTCTRACGFCSVERGAPGIVEDNEVEKISNLVKRLNLKYVIITSVARDDLRDGGASQFVKAVEAIKCLSKDIKVEILVPDFSGRQEAIERVVRVEPNILGHNIETAKRLYPTVRSGSDYDRSLALLKMVKDINPNQLTKSAILVGLGETDEEIAYTIKDLKLAGCDVLTIGQYLRPTIHHLPIERFVTPEEFERYKMIGKAIGFKSISSGPFVRSSYFAEELYKVSGGEIS